MSNPLTLFRKHQKVLLAVFGVALMIVFTVGSSVQLFLTNPAQGRGNEVVVRIGSEELRESDMQSLRFARIFLRQFMRRINTVSAQSGGTPRRDLGGIPDTNDERSLLQTQLLSQKAREMGIVVSDEAIIRFLEDYTGGRLSKGDFARELAAATGGRMSQNQFFDAMRSELLALRFMDLFQRGLVAMTPLQSWDYYQRLHRQVEIEAVPFPVARYIDPDASFHENVIEQAYEEGKDRYSFPSSPEPGYKRRKKIAVEYVEADLEPFLNEEREKITDEQIAAYYEENKEQFRKVELPDDSDFGLPTDDATSPSSTPDPTATDVDASDPDSNSIDATSTDTDDFVPLDLGPSDSNSGDDAAEADDNGSTEAVDESPAPRDDGEDDLQFDGLPPDNASLGRHVTVPVGLQTDQQSDDQSSDESDAGRSTTDQATSQGESEPSEDASVSEETSVSEDTLPSDETLPAEEGDTPDESKALEDPQVSADDGVQQADDLDTLLDNEQPESSNATSEVSELPADVGDESPDATTESPPEYTPLEEVSDEIRTQLAREPATNRMRAALDAVRARMDEYRDEHSDYLWSLENQNGEQQPEAKPTPLDLEQLAAESGLTAGKIPLVDVVGMQQTDPVTDEPLYPISRAFDTNFISFSQLAFDDKVRMYDPKSIRGHIRDVEYVYWKVDEEPEEIPSLADCRDEVIRDLKMKDALPQAVQAAKSAAEQLRSSNQAPSDAYRNSVTHKVIEAGPFSWLTAGNIAFNLPPRLSQIPGIEYPGPEFMRNVFQLSQGEIGVATDNPEKSVYVVYVKTEVTDPEQLRQTFFRTGLNYEIAQVRQQDAQRALAKWYSEFEREKSVQWEREASFE